MMTHSRTLPLRLKRGALAIVVCAMLASCAATPAQQDATYLDVSLAETKSNSQLLRNETASRIPPEIIMEVRDNVDESAACVSAEDDPHGLVRYWTSSAQLALVIFPGDDVRDIVDEVAATYVDEGWLVNSGSSRTEVSKGDDEDATVYSAVLTRGASSAAITVAAVEPDDGAAWISVDVHGPCVVTEGTDSDEVRKLEKQV